MKRRKESRNLGDVTLSGNMLGVSNKTEGVVGVSFGPLRL